MNDDDEEDLSRLNDLFQGLFSALRSRLGDAKWDDVDRAARAVLDDLKPPVQVAWDLAAPMGIPETHRVTSIGTAVRIAGHITDLRAAQLATLPDRNGATQRIEATCLQIEDRASNAIWSLDVIGPVLIDKLEALRRSGRVGEFLGIVVAVPVDLGRKRPDRVVGARSDFLLHIIDVRESTSALDLLSATSSERQWASDQLERLKGAGRAPRDWLLDAVVRGLGIVGLDDFPLLKDLLVFVVLQSLSVGEVGNAPARLNGLIVGPPSRGKKLCGLAARALNPVCSELSPGKVSAAGLVGASSHVDGSWRSRPGLLPRASSGVALLQDAHTWSRSLVAKIGAIFQEVIEDGSVRDSVAGGAVWEAQTALLIDMNRQAQAWGSGGTEAPLLDLIPLLMRLDLVAEIPEDPKAAWAVAGKMFRSTTNASRLEQEKWVRQARLMVATLRDRHDEVDIAPVLHMLEKLHWGFGNDLRAAGDRGELASRLTITMRRYVMASARGCARSVATVDDIHEAHKYCRLKVAFLEKHRVRMSECPDRHNIDEWLRGVEGQVVEPADLVIKYAKETGTTVDERTMRRHVQQGDGRRIGKGKYQMPKRTTGQPDNADDGPGRSQVPDGG